TSNTILTPVRTRPVYLFFFLSPTRPPPRSTLFPYTTLFRSYKESPSHLNILSPYQSNFVNLHLEILVLKEHFSLIHDPCPFYNRSEEHTSELQSRFDLVCRLLLEKKN